MVPLIHIFHSWEKAWTHVIRRDMQGGEFWVKSCTVCGRSKISESRPRWFL